MSNLSKFAFAAALLAATQAASQEARSDTGGYAVVTLSGKLAHSKNVADYSHVSAGTYLVVFNNDVVKCSATATIARRGKDSVLPGFIVTGGGKDNDAAVYVYTLDATTLLPTDFPFNLTVTC